MECWAIEIVIKTNTHRFKSLMEEERIVNETELEAVKKLEDFV